MGKIRLCRVTIIFYFKLFDMFKLPSGDKVSTGGVCPSHIRWVIVPAKKNMKSRPKRKHLLQSLKIVEGLVKQVYRVAENKISSVFEYHISLLSLTVQTQVKMLSKGHLLMNQ